MYTYYGSFKVFAGVTSGAVPNLPSVGIISGPTDRPVIKRLQIRPQGTAQVYGLAVVANSGIVRLANFPLTSDDPNAPTATMSTVLEWVTFPAFPTTFLRRNSASGSSGNCAWISFLFPKGLQLSPSQLLAVWDISGSNQGLEVDLELDL